MLQNLDIAQAFAWNLATTLMVCVTLIKCSDGYSAMPTDEFDGDPATIVREYDPFAI